LLPLRIAFDLDGVLADMDSALVLQAEALFGARQTRRRQDPATAPDPAALRETDSAPGDAPLPGPLRLTIRQQRRLWRRVATIENFWETLQEIEPGAVKRLAAAAARSRWEVIFLTTRPATAGWTAQRQSQRWLVSKGFERPSVFVLQGSRGRVAAALDLDVVVDDRHENCYDVVVDSAARPLLVWRERGQQLPAAFERLGVSVVRTVGECLDVLAQWDAPTRVEHSTLRPPS
jgi:hypothetical protein